MQVITVEEWTLPPGSGVSEETVAVLVILPEEKALTTPAIQMVTRAPADRVPREYVDSQGDQVAPPSVEYCTFFSWQGIWSVRTTFWASPGPALEMVTE